MPDQQTVDPMVEIRYKDSLYILHCRKLHTEFMRMGALARYGGSSLADDGTFVAIRMIEGVQAYTMWVRFHETGFEATIHDVEATCFPAPPKMVDIFQRCIS